MTIRHKVTLLWNLMGFLWVVLTAMIGAVGWIAEPREGVQTETVFLLACCFSLVGLILMRFGYKVYTIGCRIIDEMRFRDEL